MNLLGLLSSVVLKIVRCAKIKPMISQKEGILSTFLQINLEILV
jgi:hypothetical protein